MLTQLETNIEDILELAILEGCRDSLPWRTAKDLLEVHEILSIPRYISPRKLGQRHEDGMLDRLIYEYPDTAFLALFRVQRQAFWKLVERLKDKWEVAEDQAGRGPTSRPKYQQLAVGLYVLGGEGGGVERHRIALNIGYGTVQAYTWPSGCVLSVRVCTVGQVVYCRSGCVRLCTCMSSN